MTPPVSRGFRGREAADAGRVPPGQYVTPDFPCSQRGRRRRATATTTTGTPACGMSSVVAEAIVYMRGPGRVARCRGCSELLFVLVTIRDVTCVDLRGIAGFEMEI
jgi:hypothetical protein